MRAMVFNDRNTDKVCNVCIVLYERRKPLSVEWGVSDHYREVSDLLGGV